MDHPGTFGEGTNTRADDRDDVADRRDLISDQRDKAGDQRDHDAGGRDSEDSHRTHELADGYRQLRRQILDHFVRIENSTVDPADWPDLPQGALDQLHALVAQQRHSAARSQAAILTLLDELDAGSHQTRTSRLAAGRDRRAAADDRRHSAEDRTASADDRDRSAADRNQAEIEREQVDPTGAGGSEHRDAPDSPERDRAARVISDSRLRIDHSRALIDSAGGPVRRPPHPAARSV